MPPALSSEDEDEAEPLGADDISAEERGVKKPKAQGVPDVEDVSPVDLSAAIRQSGGQIEAISESFSAEVSPADIHVEEEEEEQEGVYDVAGEIDALFASGAVQPDESP